MRTAPRSGVVVVSFHEGAAGAFVKVPLHELFGATLDLEALLPASEVERTQSQLRDALTERERVAVVQCFLMRHLTNPVDALVLGAVRAIRSQRGTLRIAALAESLGIGQDALEKRFRRAVGASPKQLASIVRLHHAVTSYRPGTSLTRLALDAGYFDQAHFNRDMRAMLGESPQRFFDSKSHC